MLKCAAGEVLDEMPDGHGGGGGVATDLEETRGRGAEAGEDGSGGGERGEVGAPSDRRHDMALGGRRAVAARRACCAADGGESSARTMHGCCTWQPRLKRAAISSGRAQSG